MHFFKWETGNPLSGNKDYGGCVRKRDLGGADSSNSREATGAIIGRKTEPPHGQATGAVAGSAFESGEAIEGSRNVGPLQGGLRRRRHEIKSHTAISAAWLESVANR